MIKNRFFWSWDHSTNWCVNTPGEQNTGVGNYYAKNPEMYRGVITQFYKGLRLLLTHQEHGIAMDDIILVLGHDEVIRRLSLEL